MAASSEARSGLPPVVFHNLPDSLDRVNLPGDARPRWLFHMTRVLEGGKMGATDVLQLIGLSRRCEEEYFVYTSPPFACAVYQNVDCYGCNRRGC